MRGCLRLTSARTALLRLQGVGLRSLTTVLSLAHLEQNYAISFYSLYLIYEAIDLRFGTYVEDVSANRDSKLLLGY